MITVQPLWSRVVVTVRPSESVKDDVARALPPFPEWEVELDEDALTELDATLCERATADADDELRSTEAAVPRSTGPRVRTSRPSG